jgi:nitrate reductase gamma subunit
MINQGDIEGRLRLLRYGMVVLVVVTFLVTLLAPFAFVKDLGYSITDFLGQAILYAVVVGVIGVAVYFGYASILKRNAGPGSTE